MEPLANVDEDISVTLGRTIISERAEPDSNPARVDASDDADCTGGGLVAMAENDEKVIDER